MIVCVSIRDFVLISRLDFSPGRGFTVLTGQTGAGKSLLLDAVAVALGGPADRSLVRPGTNEACVSVSFRVGPDHPAWEILATRGIAMTPGEHLTFRRMVRLNGPARSFINDRAVSAALLVEVGEQLVELHGQHTISTLMRPSAHRTILDQFAGNERLVLQCGAAWRALEAARAARDTRAVECARAQEERSALVGAIAELERLALSEGEVERLLRTRTDLSESRRFVEAVARTSQALASDSVQDGLANARRASAGLLRAAEMICADDVRSTLAVAAVDAIERAVIEVGEAEDVLVRLVHEVGDLADLEMLETRLSALRSAARRYDVGLEGLADKLAELRARLDHCEAAVQELEKAEACLEHALSSWQRVAAQLSEARRHAAIALEAAIAEELEPLRLGKMRVRVTLSPLCDTACRTFGNEGVELEAQTNQGAGFAPLRRIGSGGELARVSLAIKCALAGTGSAATLIFDEADQGVGGAVAAAVGSRLERLSASRQVLAVTHSPQVAAAAENHWIVEKAGDSRFSLLDAAGRREEIARMLSGAHVSDEARAAAARLMEDA